MNERIRELAEQAGLKTELWYNPKPFVIYKEDANNPDGLKKFAELIWKEAYEAGYTAGCSDTFEGGV
jgi:hypothetical protein